MVDEAVVTRKLLHLEEYCNDLLEIKKDYNWEVFSQDKIVRRYVERTLHMAVESCLDIANHIISYEGYREPLDNKDTFQVLYEQDIISSEDAKKLKKMAQFRNVIVHDYIRVQPEIVFSILTNSLSDVIEFANIVRVRYL